MNILVKKLIIIFPLIISSAWSAHAEVKTARASNGTASKAEGKVADAPAQLAGGGNDLAATYESSLKKLASLYDAEVKRLTEENAKLKDLFDKGLVSRRELEQSDKTLADARAKVEGVNKEIASAKAKPAGVAALATVMPASGQAWSTGKGQIDNLIRYYGGLYGVDPYLIYCVMNQESGFSAGAVSPKGARGLMQLMPDTAARYGVTLLADPSQNVMAGTRYLKDLLKLFGGRIDLVLAAYNAGEGAVMKYGNRIPPYNETQNYVRNIIARYSGGTLTRSATKAAL